MLSSGISGLFRSGIIRQQPVISRLMSSLTTNSTGINKKTAAYLLIGDEVLSGTVQDTNGPFLANYLKHKGIDLNRIEVISDKISDIVDSIHRIQHNVDYIITTGGIGPTHDDVTYDAVAAAFGVPLEYDAKTLKDLEVYMKNQHSEVNESRKRMALFPKGCKTFYPSSQLWVPVVIVGNVHIYPGVPRIFEEMILGSDPLFQNGSPFVQWEVFTKMKEGDFAKELTALASDFPDVKIGSYPSGTPKVDLHTRLFLEGRDTALVKKVADILGGIVQAYKVSERPVQRPQSSFIAKL